ncbi:hypothetical protein GLOIN_2v1487951 [Rhizophagus clarus]|nr:hypothetical protein GLOIN_2v1487951 [Rhizophagus clarus]
MHELSRDDETQHEDDLPMLLNILISKYLFRDETNKETLFDNEINMLAETYNVIDVYPILVYDGSIFWLKDLNDTIYIWYRTDETMIYGGSINFLFHRKKLSYVNEDDYRLISMKEAKKEGIKCYREGKKAAIVISGESLLKKGKEGSKKGGGKSDKRKRINKHELSDYNRL